MLARTPHTLVYLSAADLGITERESAGLIEVRDDLASGRVKHVRAEKTAWTEDRTAFLLDSASDMFDMQRWAGIKDCGTAHCIGGFMDARGVWGADFTNYSDALRSLFAPEDIQWAPLTPAQAVRAIDHFLAGAGPDCWSMALADVPAA